MHLLPDAVTTKKHFAIPTAPVHAVIVALVAAPNCHTIAHAALCTLR